ncbi:helix-turn-helix domain-containing protein [Thermophagus sp. OGC60D27]
MRKKQILTLHLDGISNRQIGEMLGIHRNTINSYRHFLIHVNTAKKNWFHWIIVNYSSFFQSIPPS